MVEVFDLSFLADRDYPFNWFQRHYHHIRVKRSLKKARMVVAKNKSIAADIIKYYSVPKEKITIKP